MPRIEPIPLDQLADEPRRIIEEGVADGTYATPVPLQIFAYKTMQIMMTNAARGMMGKKSLLGARIVELIRIRSAQLGECQPCMQSRKHDSITDEDVACLIAPGGVAADRAGAAGRQVPRPPLGRPPRHRRRGLPGARRGLHRRPDRRAGVHLRQHHGRPSLHPHPGRFRDQPAGDPLRRRPGRHRLRPMWPSRPRHERDGLRHRRHRAGRGQHLQASDRAGRPRPGPGPCREPTPIPWWPWGSRSSPVTSPRPTTSGGPPPEPTRPSTAPPSSAGPARTSPTSRP